MKLFVFAMLFVAVAAAPQDQVNQVFDEYGNLVEEQRPQIRILSQRFNMDAEGNYEFGYEQDNGQKVEEVGRSYPGSEPETGSISKEGYFEWIADDDQQKYRVDYRADEGGFQPQADHLPVSPEQIPEYEQLRQEHPELFVGAFWLNN